MSAPDVLSIWVVYDHPADWPQYFVARRHLATGPDFGPTEDMILDVDLERIRTALVMKGLTRLPRYPEDDDVILETWL